MEASASDLDSLAAWLRLTLIPGIGGATQRKLLAAFGPPEAIFASDRETLRSAIGEPAAKLLLATDTRAAVAAALAWAQAPGCHLLTLADPDYPQALLELPDPPSLLYVRGRVELLQRPALAIVGSRHATPQGLQNATSFASALAEAGLVIASGLALGIDAAAHRGALAAGGSTVAFIGTGIDRVYPARNHELALRIGETGAIVSEFPLGTQVTAANFPRRNRLISGLARGVLVVEAAVDSGSQITARLAAEQGREVFAIPGSIHSPQSRGCHRLIKQGAKLVETAADVLEELAWPVTRAGETETPRAAPGDTPPTPGCRSAEQAAVLEFLGFEPCSLDELGVRSGLTADTLSVILLHLELDGCIASLPGSRFQRLAAQTTP